MDETLTTPAQREQKRKIEAERAARMIQGCFWLLLLIAIAGIAVIFILKTWGRLWAIL